MNKYLFWAQGSVKIMEVTVNSTFEKGLYLCFFSFQ